MDGWMPLSELVIMPDLLPEADRTSLGNCAAGGDELRIPVIDWRGPRRGCAARPACARTGMGTPEPHAGAALAGTAPTLLAGGGPPRGITTTPPRRTRWGPGSQPFAPTLPTVPTARPPRYEASAAGDGGRLREAGDLAGVGLAHHHAQGVITGRRRHAQAGAEALGAEAVPGGVLERHVHLAALAGDELPFGIEQPGEQLQAFAVAALALGERQRGGVQLEVHGHAAGARGRTQLSRQVLDHGAGAHGVLHGLFERGACQLGRRGEVAAPRLHDGAM